MSAAGSVVLVVEDDALTRAMLRDALVKAGLATVEAIDGVDGLERLQAGLRPAVILVDMVMPRLDGAGFLREVRADPELAEIPVITMSGSRRSDPDADVQFHKPFDLPDLVQIVATLCADPVDATAPRDRT